MDELIKTAIQQRNHVQIINEFLLKGLAPEQALLELMAKSCVLLGELDDTLELIKEASCK